MNTWCPRIALLSAVVGFLSITGFSQTKGKIDTLQQPEMVVTAIGAEDKLNIPDFLPATPEAMAIVKAGVGNVNLSTGAAAAKIPLYEIKIKDFRFPIFLSYATQGLKTDEASSRVGLGWTLVANGAVTRSVRGEPDEFSERLTPPADLSLNTQAVYDYLNNSTQAVGSGYDTQPDEFQFNVNGYSGKFVLGAGYVPRVTATANVKITVPITVTPQSTAGSLGPITLLTPDGVKYEFNAVEKTTDVNMARYSPYNNTTITAFFLTKVELPTGETILFNYTAINTTVETGRADVLTVNGQTSGTGDCTSCGTGGTLFTTNTDRVSYNTRYLSSITSSTGLSINFTYQARPDLSQDNRLTTLEVTGLKKYSFEYYDLANQSTKMTGRYFLTKVKDAVITGQTGDTGQDYNFTYNSMASVPLPLTKGQDVLGFYNGSANTYLIPNALGPQGVPDMAYRNPSATYATYGTLAAVSFPTGGKEEFFYEGNTETVSALQNTKQVFDIGGPGVQVYTSGMIYCPVNQTITIRTKANDRYPADGYTAPATQNTVVLRIYDGITQVASRSALGYTEDVTTYNLLAEHVYRFEVQVKYATENGNANFGIDKSPTPVYADVTENMPGLRVSRIKTTDPMTANVVNKYFKYAGLSDLTKSSGGFILPVFGSSTFERFYCGSTNQFTTECGKTIYSSSSTQSVYELAGSGSVIYYTKVIESNSPNFIYGGTEHQFFPNENGSNFVQVLGLEVPYLPSGQTPTLSGIESKTSVFNDKLAIVQEDENVYESSIDLSTATLAYYTRKKFPVDVAFAGWKDAFDAYKMTYGNYWLRVKSKISKSFTANGSLTTTTDYKYGTATNILPDTVKTTDSKGNTRLTSYKYPTSSFTGDPDAFSQPSNYNLLVNRNIITPVVQQTEYSNTTLLSKTRTLYKDWFSNSTILTPVVLQLKASTSDVLADKVVFGKYDSRGNVLEVQAKNDVMNAYVWDKEKSLPTAKATGNGLNVLKLAFTSFEITGDYGNWTYSSGSVNTTTGFAGSNCFTGTLTKTMDGVTNYEVWLWTNSSVTVNAVAGTVAKTARGWTLYKWVLTNPATITVSGTNIDELRLFPVGAQLVSFVHKPFVGISARGEVNNYFTYYDYDYRNRLKVVKNETFNILKSNEYAFAGTVTPLAKYFNDETAGYFTKTGCGAGTTGSSVQYVIPAGTYSSTISQADANQQATNALNAGGQGNANAKGTCIPIICSGCTGSDQKCINNTCEQGGFKYTSSTYQQVSIAGVMQWRYVVTTKFCFSDGTVSTLSWQEAKTTSPTLNTCLLP